MPVDVLVYELRFSKPWSLQPGIAEQFQLGDFDYDVSESRLTARPRSSHPDVETARLALEPLLRAWTAHANLTGTAEMEFAFIEGRMTESTDELPGRGIMLVNAHGPTEIRLGSLPDVPPAWFRLTPDLEELIGRWQAMEQGRESPLSGANYCLTKLQVMFPATRKDTAKALNVSFKVLHRLGELCSYYDPRFARKASPNQQTIDAAGLQWVMGATRTLIQRAVEITAGEPTALLTLTDIRPGRQLHVRPGDEWRDARRTSVLPFGHEQ